MGLVINDEVDICKAFPSMLSENTFTWFTSLKPETIASWRTLEKSYLDKFSTAGTMPKTRVDLANVKQGEDETLLAYMKGTVKMKVTLGTDACTGEEEIKFYDVDIDSPYNAIQGTLAHATLGLIILTSHQQVRFAT